MAYIISVGVNSNGFFCPVLSCDPRGIHVGSRPLSRCSTFLVTFLNLSVTSSHGCSRLPSRSRFVCLLHPDNVLTLGYLPASSSFRLPFVSLSSLFRCPRPARLTRRLTAFFGVRFFMPVCSLRVHANKPFGT